MAAAGLIVVATVAAYLPALRSGFIWDDDDYVTENDVLTTPGGLVRIWKDPGATPQYYPLVFTSFWIERHLWGLDPVGYHVVNVLLHIANALFLWRILQRLRIPGAFLAAMIFALHPVHVESVAWITERKNVLSGFLYFGSLACYLRFADLPDSAPDRPRRWKYYAFAILLFCSALLSKSVTASLPAAVLLIIWMLRGRLTRREIWPLAPFFMLGLAMGLLSAWVERHYVGTAFEGLGLSFTERILLAGRALWFYFGKLVWPHPLIFVYPRWHISSQAVAAYAFPAAALILVFALWLLRKRWGKGPLVAALFFGGTLVPALGFVDIFFMNYSYVADHFQYLASIGPIVLMSGVAVAAMSKASWRPVRRTLSALLLVLLGVLTFRQSRMYADTLTLFETTIRGNPACWMAHNNLGTVLDDQGRSQEAIDHYRRALELRPEYPDAHNNLGAVLEQLGRHDEALAAYHAALRFRPNFPEAHFNLGVAYAAIGHAEQAIEHYQRALRLRPDYSEAYNNLGMILNATGRHDEAIAAYEEALQLRPQYSEAYGNLIVGLIDAQRVLDAIDRARDAVRRFPDNAPIRVNLGIALTLAGRPQKALSEFEEAARLRPDLFEAQANLAVGYESAGRIREALAAGARALAIARSGGDGARGEQMQAWLAACRARAGGALPRVPLP